MIALLLILACASDPAPEPTAPKRPDQAGAAVEPEPITREPAPGEPTPADPCDMAWTELEILAEGLRERYGEQVRAPAEPEFRAACERLPPAVRPCLSPRWANANPERCARAVEGLTRPERERFERALSPAAP